MVLLLGFYELSFVVGLWLDTKGGSWGLVLSGASSNISVALLVQIKNID